MTTLSTIFLTLMLTVAPDSAATPNDVLCIGDNAPMFYAKNLSGDDFFLSKKVGPKVQPEKRTPILISFFSTTCVPCRQEIGFLHTLRQEFPQVEFYLIDISEPEETVKPYVTAMKWSIPILIDRWSGIAGKYKATITPTLVLIAEDGKVSFFKRGYDAKFDETIRQQLRKLTENRAQSPAK
ncbi:MAG: TlpA disulfide reductase family protein [Candidatus Neomarinimicrobiota bacterium]